MPANGRPVTATVYGPVVPRQPRVRRAANFFSELSTLTWRHVSSTDWVHYAVRQHPVLEDAPCNDVPAACLTETPEFEKNRLTPIGLTGRRQRGAPCSALRATARLCCATNPRMTALPTVSATAQRL